MDTITFELREGDEYIQLSQLLKATNTVYSGAEAKELILAGAVLRNNEVELRVRAKITRGETIQTEGVTIVIE